MRLRWNMDIGCPDHAHMEVPLNEQFVAAIYPEFRPDESKRESKAHIYDCRDWLKLRYLHPWDATRIHRPAWIRSTVFDPVASFYTRVRTVGLILKWGR
jgi:hypothetical protein